MSVRSLGTLRILCLSALALAGPSSRSAEPSPSLAEKRLSIIKGTTPGIVIFDFGTAPRPAASAPAGATGEAQPATAAASPAARNPPFLSTLPPPSGRPLNSARRLDAPDQGVALPTAKTAAPSPPASAPKP